MTATVTEKYTRLLTVTEKYTKLLTVSEGHILPLEFILNSQMITSNTSIPKFTTSIPFGQTVIIQVGATLTIAGI